MNTKLIHHRGIHKALPTCYTYWQKIIGRLSSTRVTDVAMGTASTSVIQKCFLPWESTKIFLQGGSLSITVNKATGWKPKLPMALLTSVASSQAWVWEEAMKHLGAVFKEVLALRVLQVWTLPLHDPDNEPSSPAQPASLVSRARPARKYSPTFGELGSRVLMYLSTRLILWKFFILPLKWVCLF